MKTENIFRNHDADTDNGMFISTCIAGINVDFLLDSGSTASLLSDKIYYAIPKEIRPELVHTDIILHGVNGSPVKSFGVATLVITLEGTNLEIPAIVCDMKSDAILGQDFNLKYVKTINFQKNHLITQDDLCIPFKIGGKAAMTCRITCAKHLKMPPRSIINVPVDILGSEYLDKSIMIEPSLAAVSRKVVLAPQILPNKSVRPNVTLINIAYEETEVYANMHVGTAQSAYDRKDIRQVRVRQTTKQTPDNTSSQSQSTESKSNAKEEFPEHLTDVLERSSGFIDANQKESFKQKLWKYEHIWSRNSDDFGQTHLTTFKINTGNAKPIRQPYRRLPLAKKEAERAEIKRMLEKNIIEESNSAWASPICLVSKPDGSVRFCVDYRKLNEVTEKDAFPLPRIDDCLDALSGAEFFGTQDLCSGFWQIPLDSAEDREKTAFLTSMGLYQFTILSFGLTNAPACFQRLMQEVLRGLQWEECVLFMDDTIVPSKDFEEGLERLEHVWERFSQAGLKLKPSKCLYFQREIKFLGHIVSKNGVKTDPAKTKAVDEWPQPKTAKQMRSFLGLASYYRRFIQDFASIARPLHKLCDKGIKFQWTDACEEAFQLLKQKLVNSPILAYPLVGEQYVLDTDASDLSIGAVLSQIQDGTERVIAYYSKALNASEVNYCVTRKELLAVISALRKFHSYIYGQKVIVRTDNSAVSWVRNLKAPNGQVARWLQELCTYDLDVRHRVGSQHRNADALSRSPCATCSRAQQRDEVEQPTPRCRAVETETSKEGSSRDSSQKSKPDNQTGVKEPVAGPSWRVDGDEINSSDTPTSKPLEWEILQSTFLPPKWTKEEFRQAQLDDPDVSRVLKWKEDKLARPLWREISNESSELKILWTSYERLEITDGLLVRCFLEDGEIQKSQLVVPKAIRSDVLSLAHDIPSSGHLATEKMLDRLRRRFYWPKMNDSVKQYVVECDKCTARKTPKGKRHAPMGLYQMGEPMERVSMDILGPLPVSEKGNRYVLVVCDTFTRWIEAYPLQNQEASTIARVFVNEFVCRFGAPLQVLSDQGRNFEGRILKDACTLLHIDKSRTTSYNPKANGTCERFNRTLQNMISMYCNQNQRNWDEYIPQLLMAYRSTKNGSTDQTPNQMVLGRDITLPMEAVVPNVHQPRTHVDTTEYVIKLQKQLRHTHELARKSLKRSVTYQKKRYDLAAQKRKFEKGDLVWVHETVPKPGLTQKLAPLWKGPYLITKRIDDLVYMVKRGADLPSKAHHIDRLMKYRGNRKPKWCQITQAI